jgi:hypothetical protein
LVLGIRSSSVSSASVIDVTLVDAYGFEVPLVGTVTLCFVAYSDPDVRIMILSLM